MLELLFELHKKSVEAATLLRFNKDEEIQRVIIGIYATLIEQSGSLALLLGAKKPAGTDAILRSLLEAYADLKALIRDPAYLEYMHAAFYHEWLRLFREELPLGEDEAEVQEQVYEYKASLDALAKRGIRPLTNTQRLAKAGFPDAYRVTYNMLCAESHNNLRAIYNRHMDSSGGELKINLSNPDPDTSTTERISTGILLDASIAVHFSFAGGRWQEFEDLERRFNQITSSP